jgi:hypothetical protein
MKIVYHLNTLEIKSANENGKRVSLVLIILDLLYRISQHLTGAEKESVDCNALFSMLMLRPDLSRSRKNPDLNDVVNFIPQDYRKHVADALTHFVHQLLPSNHLEQTSWVYVVPLIHALDGKLDKATSLGARGIKWVDDRVDMQLIGKIRANAFSK